MMRYIPGFILQHYKNNIFNGKLRGFALLFDIADFTPITEHFNKHGKQGAEELRAFLDFAFGEPIRIVESYGGFVTLFAGDAFCAVFPDKKEKIALSRQRDKSTELTQAAESGSCPKYKAMSDKDRILSAVLKINRFFADRSTYQCPLGDMRLKIRQTVSYGDIKWQIFKNSLQNDYVFYGKPLKDLADLSGLKKELIFSRDAAEHIGITLFKKIKKDGYIYSKETKFNEPEYTEEKDSLSEYPTALSAFINPKYQNVIPQPEIRSAAFCFANLGKIAFKDRQEAISRIQILADKYGGFVTRYDATDKGMAALILFGMPISEERTLERICRFSLDITVQVPLLAIGLAKGNVYAGYTGSGDIKEYTALGNPVNLASRLMGKARSGEVITDSLFYREIMDKFLFEEKGKIQLKGIKQSVIIYRLDKQLAERRISRLTNFIGRDKSLKELKRSIDEALAKNRNLAVYIYGNAGIGKTRLCNELTDSFPEQEFNRFFLHCDSVIQRSLEPVKQIIRQYFLSDPEQDQLAGINSFQAQWKLLAGQDAELIRIESIIASVIGYEWEHSTWSILPPPERPRQQKNAFLRFMAEIASKRPVVIHLDDAQWIDEESKEYLQAMSEADIRPVQIICSCRYLDDGSRPDLILKNHIKLDKDLAMLDEESSREMIRHILKLDRVPQETLREINSRATGNPFYIEQLCAYLIEIEKIDREGNITGELGPVASFEISDIIGSRIDRLTANVRECVYNASVLGMEFNVKILSKMLNRPLEPDLEAGKSNMIWRDLEELHYIFSHILIKDTAYLRIMYNKLKKLHHLAAEAMEIVLKDTLDEHAQEIAFHYERADIPDKGAFYYNKAGCWFRDKYNFANGELFLKKALEMREKVLGTDNSVTACSLNDLASLYHHQGKYQIAEALYKRSLQINEKALGIENPEVVIPIQNLAILYKDQGKYDDAEPLYKRSLQIREKVLGKDHPHVAISLDGLATLYKEKGKYAEAEPLYLRSMQIFEKVLGKDHLKVTDSLNNLGILYANQGKFSIAEPLFKRSLQLREKALGNDHPHVAQILNNLAILYRSQGNYLEAEPLYKRSMVLREKALGKDHPLVAQSLNNIALLYKDQGKYDDAEPLYVRSLQIYEKAVGKEHPHVAQFLSNLALLYTDQGKYQKAEPLFKQAVQIADSALGSEHPTTLKYRKDMKDCQEEIKKTDK